MADALLGARVCRSKVIQNLPPVIFTLMKSTEPHSDAYYTFNVEVTLMSVNCSVMSPLQWSAMHAA